MSSSKDDGIVLVFLSYRKWRITNGIKFQFWLGLESLTPYLIVHVAMLGVAFLHRMPNGSLPY